MEVEVEIGGRVYEVLDYSVSEDGTPLSAGDSSGSVGSVTITLVLPDPGEVSDDPFWLYGAEWFIGEPFRLSDSYKGFTLGSIEGVSVDYDSCTASLSGVSRLGELNIFNIHAQPYVGSLSGAFEYYLSLANIDSNFFVDPDIAMTPVIFPGFAGELWYRLKQMAAAVDAEISLVSGNIVLRPVRTRVAERDRDVSRSAVAGSGPLAQTVEVYWYPSRSIEDELVYPPGGWNPDVEVLNVNAGETSEYQLELSASVSEIQEPTMTTFVPQDYDTSSVYTVVADDGLPVDPQQWVDNGGSVEVTINPDTTTLSVKLVGATNIPVATGGVSKSFSLALASDESGSRYSTLRIVGTGVAYTRTLHTFRTGVPESRTSTVVGETIDNPYITTYESLMRAGLRGAKRWTGMTPTLTGGVVSINQRGDSGVVSYMTYGEVQSALESELPSPTYEDVQTYYTGTLSLTSYRSVLDYWFSFVESNYENQVFGNVSGTRVWDDRTRRWYRIRSGTLTPQNISISTADDDLLYAEIEGVLSGMTYGDVQALKADFTYQQDRMAGAYSGS